MEIRKRITALSDDTRVYEVAIGSYCNPDQLCVVSCASDRQVDAFMLAFQRAVDDYSIDEVEYKDTDFANEV